MSKPTNAWHGEIFFPEDHDAVTPKQNALDYAALFRPPAKLSPEDYKFVKAGMRIIFALAALFLAVLWLLFW